MIEGEMEGMINERIEIWKKEEYHAQSAEKTL